MLFTRLVVRCRWFNLSSTLLILLLQRTPLLRCLVTAESSGIAPATNLARPAFAAAVAVAGVNALTGASTYLVSDITVPAQTTVGAAFKMSVAVQGTGVSYAQSWDVSNTLPPGIAAEGATLQGNKWVINQSSGVLILSGSPTASGTFTFTIDGWEKTNLKGTQISGSTSITVAAAASAAPAFTQQPVSRIVDAGTSVSFSVTATGNPAPTLQWRHDGAVLTGQTGSLLTLPAVSTADGGNYDCVASNSAGSATSTTATLTVNVPAAPSIVTQPTALRVKAGSSAFFAVSCDPATASYQWRKDGTDLPGATGASLFLASIQPADAGSYSVHLSSSGGQVDSDGAALTVVADGRARLANLSTRALVGTGDNVLIPGFVVGGGGTKTLLIRAAGPRLLDFGITSALLDPTATLYSGTTSILANDNWPDFSDQNLLESTRSAVSAFAFAPSTRDSAMVVTIPVNGASNTVVTSGVGGTTGVALVELYDADPIDSPARLVNISARAMVGTGDNVLIPGFYIEGDVAATLLIRASGPTLGANFGVSGTLADPVIELFHTLPDGSSVPVTSNDDWENTPDLADLDAITAASNAFPLNHASADAALLVALAPGGYTVKISGKNNTSGVALVELYLVGP